MEETGFEQMAAEQQGIDKSYAEQAFQDIYNQQQSYFSEQKAALNSTTMLAALATLPEDKSPALALTQGALDNARQLLEKGDEKLLRNQLANKRIEGQLRGLNTLTKDLDYLNADPKNLQAAQTAYEVIKTTNREDKERIALEQAAVDKIQSMAMSDPVQARLLLDNFEYGPAEQTIHDFNVKLSIMRQRAEELDHEYQQSGWGRWMLNLALGLIPTNFNLQQTGIMGTAGIGSFLAVGSAKQRESEEFWHKALTSSNEDFARFMEPDGEFMRSVRDNATSVFDAIDDPGAAVDIMNDMITYTDSEKTWDNIWGGVEIASAIPIGRIAGVTRGLVFSGAAKDAARNIANFTELAEKQGVNAAERMTGVTEREAVEEVSLSAMKGKDEFVPLTEPVAATREAAEQAAKEILNTPDMSVYRNVEELQQHILGRVDELRARTGSVLKDIHMRPVKNPGGPTTYRMVFTIGKKDGFGAASRGAMQRILNQTGLSGEVFQESVERTVPKFNPESKVDFNHKTVNAEDGASYYYYDVTSKDGDKIPVSFILDHKTGVADMDIGGLSVNNLGAKEVRAIAARIADENPEIKSFSGSRATGAKSKSGLNLEDNGAIATVSADALRGQTRIVRDMSGQFFAKIEVDMPVTGWLVGKLAPEHQGFVSRMIGRWTQSAARISDPILHGQALEANSYVNRAMKDVVGRVDEIYKGLGGKSKEVVRALMGASAIRSKWLTEAELNFAVERQYGRLATEAEIKAYNDLRFLNDVDYELHNTALYLDGVQKGKESVKFTTRWGQEIDEDVIIDYNMEKIPVERVYDVSRAKHYVHGRNPLDTKTLKTMKNNGYVLVSVPEGFKLPEGIVVNKLLIKKTDIEISPLRRQQLAYSPGGHRMYTAKYYVKQGRKGKQADTGTEYLLSPSTFRTAENLVEGNKWAEVMNKARLARKENPAITAQELDDEIFKNSKAFPSGQEFLDRVIDETYDLDNPFETVFDRDMPSMYNKSGEDVSRLFNEDELGINGYYRTTGRMYTSHKGEILRDTEGELSDILDPYDMMVKSMQQVTRHLGLFAYKQNAIERFVNTYKEFLAADPNLRTPAQILMDGQVRKEVGLEMKNQIEAQRNAIFNTLRFETPGDRLSRQAWQTMAEKALGDNPGLGRKLAHDAVWWFRENNPISALRGIAFDMKLGMFNPAQLLIQASTMGAAAAINPKYGLRGISGLMPMHAYLLKGGSEAVLDTLAKRGIAKVMGFDTVDEFKAYARHMYKHGFLEMNGTHIMINNYSPSAHFGSFGDKVNRFREQSRVFFYTSEVWNRLTAYRIAWGEAVEKGLMPTHPEFNATVLKLADDYSFNMTNESAAWWQRGLLSIPTQFWAYNARMMDMMFGSRLSGAQKARLMAYNFGIAGAAGIPGASAITAYINQKTGSNPDPDTVHAFIDRGVIDFMNYQLTGMDVEIGERYGTGSWITETVKGFMGNSEYGDKSAAEFFGGATFSIAASTSKTLYNLGKYFVLEQAEDGHELTKESFLNMLKEVSTFSNASKAMMIHQAGLYKSNKGSILADEIPQDAALYAALSFRPAKADEVSTMMAWKKNKDESLKEVASKMRNWRQEALTTGEWDKYSRKANALLRLVPQGDRLEVIRRTNSIDDKSFYAYVERKVADEQAQQAAAETAMEGVE